MDDSIKKKKASKFEASFRHNLRFKDVEIYNQIRKISMDTHTTVNDVLNQIIKFGLPIYLKALTCSTEEEISPAENQNYAKILKQLQKFENYLDDYNYKMNQILRTQNLITSNLEVNKFITSSLYLRQKKRDEENPNLRKFSEAEENYFDHNIPDPFKKMFEEYILQLYQEEEDEF